MEGFAALGLSEPILRAIEAVGFEEPTPIQRQAIPLMLDGRDVIAQAQTGTGKTAAFALPIIQRLKPDQKGPQALVLAPTRELAVQVAQAFYSLGKFQDIRVLAVYGGQPIERQLRALRFPVDIVVGTPGRIMDHLRRETLSFEETSMVVLDEADEMLDMGFVEDIEWILDQVPEQRQIALFSATIPNRIADLSRRYLRKPVRIAIEPERVTVPLTEQVYYQVVPRAKVEALTRILDLAAPSSAIIFCRTKREVDDLTQKLESLSYPAEALHGDLSQVQRDRVMGRFRSGQTELLVATDVASRGLDIEQVSHVINYDIPLDPESYVHRIGRTGRAGRPGVAITLVTPRESRLLRAIERATGGRIERRSVPTAEEIAARQRELLGESLATVIQQDELGTPMMIVEELSTYYDLAEVAAAAIKLLMRERGTTEAAESIGQEITTEPGMARLVLNVGRTQGIRPNDIVGAIANEARIPGKSIGQIDIFDNHTYVDVPEAFAERVVRALNRSRLRGKSVHVEIATSAVAGGRR